jgi:hypothetical protein
LEAWNVAGAQNEPIRVSLVGEELLERFKALKLMLASRVN